jgi:uncharacterized protein
VAVAHEVLHRFRTWAVVGCSPNPTRDSHQVARVLQRHGYTVVPVNPTCGDELLGERCYASVTDIPPSAGIEVVDLFRRSELVGPHVDEAIRIGAKAVWFQLGVHDPAAAARAREAGLLVVEDRCPAIELPRLSAA